jgi:hypothetical protein
VPAADTGGAGTFTASYYANDFVRSIAQNGLTQTFDLDPTLRISTKTYEYPSDPVNERDLDGRMPWKKFLRKFKNTMKSIRKDSWNALERAGGVKSVKKVWKIIKKLTPEAVICLDTFMVADTFKNARTGKLDLGVVLVGPYRLPALRMKFKSSDALNTFVTAVKSCSTLIPWSWLKDVPGKL